MAWQIQEAKQKFSEVVDCAIESGPQLITRRGVEVAVIVSIEEYERLAGRKPDLVDFLLSPSGPYLDDLDLERRKDLPREIEW